MMNKKVAYVTGFRADYGIVRKYLMLLQREVKLTVIATGALLEEKYGRQVKLIYQDGFTDVIEVPYEINNDSDATVVCSMASVMSSFAKLFVTEHFDLLIILGDRYEMLSIAIAAAMQKVPILHLHGGEATYANYDEFIRHAITKMSSYHFTATERYRKRVIQLGERPDTVFYLGALGAENCMYIDENYVPSEIRKLKDKKYCVVLFHPETLSGFSPEKQTRIILDAVSCYPDADFVFLGTNADTGADIIRKMVKQYVATHHNTYYFENLHTDAYHYLVKNSMCLIGNSSSGLIEAPSLGVYTINIGDRQAGRERGNTVIDVPCEAKSIEEAITKVMNQPEVGKDANPYYKVNAAEHYTKQTLLILDKLNSEKLSPKVFYDLDFDTPN